MTKLFSADFLNQEKLIRKTYAKGSEFTEAVYLNFEASKAICMNSKSDYFVFPFTYEGDKLPNFFINSEKFLFLCKSYQELTLNSSLNGKSNSVTFNAGKDQFNIGILIQDYGTDINCDPSGMTLLFDYEEKPEHLRELSKAFPFIDLKANLSTSFFHLFYADGFCYGLTNKCVYETKTPFQDMVSIKAELVPILNRFEKCKLYYDSDKFLITNGVASYLSSTYSDVKPLAIHSDNFKATYSASSYIKVEKDSILKALSILTGFNESEYVVFISYAENQLSLVSKNADIIKKSVEVVEANRDIMEEMVVKANMLISILQSMSEAYVYIFNDSEKNSFEIRNGLDDWTEHAICVKVNID